MRANGPSERASGGAVCATASATPPPSRSSSAVTSMRMASTSVIWPTATIRRRAVISTAAARAPSPNQSGNSGGPDGPDVTVSALRKVKLPDPTVRPGPAPSQRTPITPTPQPRATPTKSPTPTGTPYPTTTRDATSRTSAITMRGTGVSPPRFTGASLRDAMSLRLHRGRPVGQEGWHLACSALLLGPPARQHPAASVAVAHTPLEADRLDPVDELAGARRPIRSKADLDEPERLRERNPAARVSDVEHELVEPGAAGREDLEERHQDPIPAERAAAPVAGVDRDRCRTPAFAV